MTDSNSTNFDQELITEFIEEAREHLQSFSDGLLQLEEDLQNPDVVNKIFRSIHTIKGCSCTLGFVDIGKLSHIGENILDAIRSNKLTPTPEIMNSLFQACDLLVSLLADIEEGSPQGQREAEIEPLLTALTNHLEQGKKADTPPPPPQKAEDSQDENIWPEPGRGLSLELVSEFVTESTDHIEQLDAALLEMEKDPENKECINTIFRAVHNIKGTSDYVGLKQIKTLSHSLETALDRVRKGNISLTSSICDLIFEAADSLKGMINNLTPNAEQDSDMRNLVRRLGHIADGEPLEPEDQEGVFSDPQLSAFIKSAAQHIESIQNCYKKLSGGDISAPVIDALHRSAKTLINSAKFVKHEEFIEPTTAIFDVADLAKQGRVEFDELMLSIITENAEKLSELLDQLRKAEAGKPRLGDKLVQDGVAVREEVESVAEQPMRIGDKLVAAGVATREQVEAAASGKPSGKAVTSKTMRVDQRKLDDYINLAGELVIARNGLLHAYQQAIVGSLELRRMKDAIQSITRITTDIQDNAMAMRMVPVKTVFQRFPRMARDIAKAHNKKTGFQIFGEETELDKQVAEALGDPLVHLIRNSADHGIETPEVRRAAGKSETGTLTLKAGREGNFIVIDIIDDGAGINVDKVKAKAVANGVITQAEADALPHEKALELVFAAGLSTAEKVSDISGRGVGMDVVRSNINSLSGTISIQSEPGIGTQMRILLPLTLAVTTVVLSECAGGLYAIPMEAVIETVKVLPTEITKMKGRHVVSLRGEVIGIRSLKELLALQKGDDFDRDAEMHTLLAARTDYLPIIIVAAGGTRFGLIVDKLMNQQEIVIKPLPSYLAQLPGIGGATIMGDGTIVLVLDPTKLFDLATDAIVVNQQEPELAMV